MGGGASRTMAVGPSHAAPNKRGSRRRTRIEVSRAHALPTNPRVPPIREGIEVRGFPTGLVVAAAIVHTDAVTHATPSPWPHQASRPTVCTLSLSHSLPKTIFYSHELEINPLDRLLMFLKKITMVLERDLGVDLGGLGRRKRKRTSDPRR